MNIQKFLVTSAMYLSISCAGAATAAERDTQRHAGTGTASTETRAQKDDARTYTRGNDKLRFTVRERQVLEQYAGKPQTRTAGDDDRDDDHEDADSRGGHGHGKQKSLPPGLQKKVDRGGELPPGWKKKLARGDVLPQDVYRAGKPLPADVRKSLPPDPPGTITVDIDGEVVRVLQKTREITDILRQR